MTPAATVTTPVGLLLQVVPEGSVVVVPPTLVEVHDRVEVPPGVLRMTAVGVTATD
jgi:hypothetical protein